VSEEQKVSQSGEPQLVSFRAYPIETAPKDREIALLIDGKWFPGKWDSQPYGTKPKPYWCSIYYQIPLGVARMRDNQPTLWAELSEMVPTSELGSTKEGGSLPASPSEAKSSAPTEEESREAFDAEFHEQFDRFAGYKALSGHWWDAAIKWMSERKPSPSEAEKKCRKCGGEMKPGKALKEGVTSSTDDIGDGSVVTLNPSGQCRMVDCMKCSECGWSFGA